MLEYIYTKGSSNEYPQSDFEQKYEKNIRMYTSKIFWFCQ